MLAGEYSHNLDPKGRLTIPSKFRKVLGTEFMVTKGLDGCLFIYPESEWKRMEEKLREMSLTTNQVARKFTRFMLGSAVEGGLDKQGRILLPQPLKAYAGLDKEVRHNTDALDAVEARLADSTLDADVRKRALETVFEMQVVDEDNSERIVQEVKRRLGI